MHDGLPLNKHSSLTQISSLKPLETFDITGFIGRNTLIVVISAYTSHLLILGLCNISLKYWSTLLILIFVVNSKISETVESLIR